MDFVKGRPFRTKNTKTKHKNKMFTGLSQDFLDLVYVFFSPVRNDPEKCIKTFLPPTQSRDNPAHLFMFMCFFLFHETNPEKYEWECPQDFVPGSQPVKSKRGREEGDGTENVINCRDACRKLS